MESYLNNIDTEKIDTLLQNTSSNVKYFNETCDKVIKEYCHSLDNLMREIYAVCIKSEEATLENLEKYYLELSNLVYFMISRVEQLGVFADMSLSASKEVYSKSYIANSVDKDEKGKSKSTVAELQAQANLASQYESVVSSIYDHAYKVVKGKVSSAQDMCSCLKRIIMSRNSAMQLSMTIKQ